MPERVHVDGRDHDVPDKEFDEGPPGEKPTNWDSLDDATKHARWADWFRLGGELDNLEAARKLAKALNQTRAKAERRNVELLAYGDSSLARPIELTIPSGQQYPDVNGNNAGPAQRDVSIIPREFNLGPADANGRLDPSFKAKNEAAKKAAWINALTNNPDYRLGDLSPNQLMQRDVIERVNDWRLGERNPHLDGRLDKLLDWVEDNPKKASAAGIPGFLVFLGAMSGLAYLFMWLATKSKSGNTGSAAQPNPPAPPSNIELKATTLDGKNTIAVSWDFSAGSQPAPTKFRVTLINEKGDETKTETPDITTKSVEFTGIPDGTWHALVVAVNASAESEAVKSDEVILPVSTVPTSGAPGKPVNVTGIMSFSHVSRKRGITVTWEKPATGSDAAGYKVSIKGVKPVIPPIPAATTTMTSARFEDGLEDGTFRAVVEAYNATGTSGEVESNDIVFTAKAAKAPSAPTGVEAHQFVPDGAQKASLTVLWDASDEEISAHRVTLSKDSTPTSKDEIKTNSTQFDALDEGTYAIQVFAQNTAGESKPSDTLQFTVDLIQAKKNIDWITTIGQSTIDSWETLQKQMTKMDQDTVFWPFIIDLLEDKHNQHGGVASYEDQVILAGLLTQWITRPNFDLSDGTQNFLANRLIDQTNPPFPKTPSVTPYTGDPVVLWKSARNLKNKMGADYSLRHRLFAILRALENYLGVHNP